MRVKAAGRSAAARSSFGWTGTFQPPGRAGRRRHIVEISNDGETELDAADARIAAVDDEVLHALSPEERAAFHQLLVRAVSADGPPCDDRHGEV